LERTLNKQFPNQLPFQNKAKVYKEFHNQKNVLVPKYAKGVVRGSRGKSQFGLGSKVP
jgi:hypothetical protein